MGIVGCADAGVGEAGSLVRSISIVDGVGVGAGAGSAQRLMRGPGESVVRALHFTDEGVEHQVGEFCVPKTNRCV